jgi:hypothetical protein
MRNLNDQEKRKALNTEGTEGTEKNDAELVLVAQTSVCVHFRWCENQNHSG